MATPGQDPGPAPAPGWGNRGQANCADAQLQPQPPPQGLPRAHTDREGLRPTHPGWGAVGAGGQKPQKQDWSSAPQACAHPPEVSVSFHFPLSLGRGENPLLLEATPPLHSLSSWTLGTTPQIPAPVPCLRWGRDHLNRLLLPLSLAPSQQQSLFPGNPSVAVKSQQAPPPTSQVPAGR